MLDRRRTSPSRHEQARCSGCHDIAWSSSPANELTGRAFERHFVRAGARCWLIKAQTARCSKSIEAYLDSIPGAEHDNYTCNAREPWYMYAPHPVPRLLVSSGFTDTGPKVLINSVRAHAVGGVTGVQNESCRRVRGNWSKWRRRTRLPIAKTLKKVEVRQLNTVLKTYLYSKHGKKRS